MPSKQIQLFLLPYAGGSVASFKRLTNYIDEKIECITVEYPGRGTRVKDPLADSFESLLSDAADYCIRRRKTDLPYAMLGYSMGSILAYELIYSRKIPGDLLHFFIGAEVSPKDRSIELRRITNPTEERILARARKLGGLDERMLENRRFADIYLKPMISDYRLFLNYEYGEDREPIVTDTTVFYCGQDTLLDDVQKWEELIQGNFDYYEFGSDHFFINQHAVEMAEVINKKVTLYLAGEDK